MGCKMTKKALVVGINNYKQLPQLNGCVNDATELSKRLRSTQYGFDVEVMTENEVTRKSLRSAINLLLSNADFSLFYFAGHGIRTSVNTCLATFDSEWDDEGVDVNYLVDAVNRLAKSNQTVVAILDCCHSGDTPFPTSSSTSPISQTDVPAINGNCRLVMAACLGGQKAKEGKLSNEKNHGIFTAHLLAALDGAAADKDRNVTALAVYEYIASELEASGTQRPILRGDQSGRIILAGNVKPTRNFPALKQDANVVSEIIREAEAHTNKYFESVQQIGLKDFESRGHKEASQRLAPIIEWFQRQISNNDNLLRDVSFRKSWTNILQQYQHLSNITSGVVLEKSREVGEFIGSGTFGSVWKINTQHESPRCFKSYHATELRDTEKVARFNRGYRAMSQLDHPNIVKVFENTVVPLGFFMQYIEGANLRQYNPATSCDIGQILDILLDVGETLSHAHGRNVLHRDVKPENILLAVSENGEISPFLTDFDLSWFSTATKLTKLAGDGFGSHFYAAPEQMNSPSSHAAHRPSVDAYSFGQVMFYSLCGRDPAILSESGNIRAFDEHLSTLPITEKIASELTSLYRECTSLAPDKRLSDFRQICDRLSKALTLIRTTDEAIPSHQFLQELRFLISGIISKQGDRGLHGNVSIKTPSGRTEICILLKHESLDKLSIEATFIPAQSPVVTGAGSASDARRVVNERIDSVLNKFSNHHPKRSAPKGGAYQSIVAFDGISKNADGLSICRELLMGVADSIERP